MKSAVVAGIAGAIGAALLLILAAGSINLDEGAAAYVSTFRGSQRGLDALLANGDGQSYAAIGSDPTLAQPGVFPTRAEAAYRAQRPVAGELAWIGSLGEPARVPLALAVLAVLSAGVAVTALGVMLSRRRASAFYALGVFALPGAISTVYGMSPEFLGLAVVTVGLLLWESRPPTHTTPAVAAFTVAGLVREEFLLVPLALVVLALVNTRSIDPRPSLLKLSIPFAVYGAWIGFVRLRIGAWPVASRSKRVSLLPFEGLIDALRDSPSRISILVWLVLAAAIALVVLIWGERDVWRASTLAFAGLAIFLGPEVWSGPENFARVLLPLFAYGSIIAALVVRRLVVPSDGALVDGA